MTPEELVGLIREYGNLRHDRQYEAGGNILVRIHAGICEMIAAEREACAKVSEDAADRAYRRFECLGHDHKGRDMIECLAARGIAAAIRERE